MKDTKFEAIRNLAYEKENGEIYELLTVEEEKSVLYGKTYADVFIHAMTLGFKLKNRLALKKRNANVVIRALSEKQEWLIKSIAIAETGTLEILKDTKEVLKIAEEYANGGIVNLKELTNKAIVDDGEYAPSLSEDMRKNLERPEVKEILSPLWKESASQV